MSMKTSLTLIACGLAIALFQPLSVMAATPTLAGSWQLTFTPITPPSTPVIPIPGLATFTTEGSVVETDGTELAPGVSATGATTYGSPGHGIWQLLPSSTGFYISYINVNVTAAGGLSSRSVTVATGTATVSSGVTTFNGTYTTTTAGPSGVTTTTTGTLTGTLIPHPALP